MSLTDILRQYDEHYTNVTTCVQQWYAMYNSRPSLCMFFFGPSVDGRKRVVRFVS